MTFIIDKQENIILLKIGEFSVGTQDIDAITEGIIPVKVHKCINLHTII